MSDNSTNDQKVALVKTVLAETFTHRAATFKERPNGTNYVEMQAAMLAHQAAYNPGFTDKAIHLYDKVGVGRWAEELADEALATINRYPDSGKPATTTVKRNPK